MKYLLPAGIAISMVAFGIFIFFLQFYIRARPPGISYLIDITSENKNESIQVATYAIPDSLLLDKEQGKSVAQKKPRTLDLPDQFSVTDDMSSAIEGSHAPSPSTSYTKKIRELKLKPEKTFTYGPKIIAMNKNPKLMLWILTFSLMVAVSIGLSFTFFGELLQLRKIFIVTKFQWKINITAALLLFIILFLLNIDGNSARTFLPPFDIVYDLNAVFSRDVFSWIYTGIGFAFFAGGVGFLGIFILHSIMSNDGKRSRGALRVDFDKLNKSTYQILKTSLDLHLAGLSILVVFSILTIAFMNQTLLGHFANIEELQIVRPDFIYAYGFIFSSILAIIYIPTNQRLHSSIEPDEDDPRGREKNSIFTNFSTLLSILAPLLSSGISELVNTVSSI